MGHRDAHQSHARAGVNCGHKVGLMPKADVRLGGGARGAAGGGLMRGGVSAGAGAGGMGGGGGGVMRWEGVATGGATVECGGNVGGSMANTRGLDGPGEGEEASRVVERPWGGGMR